MQRTREIGFFRLAAVAIACGASLAAFPAARGDLVGFWKFNEATGGSVAADSSGFNNTGTLTAGATFASDPQRGQVLSTAYSSQRVQVPFGPTSSLATLNTAFTFSMWVKETANSNYGHILVLSDNQSTNRNWLWQSENASGGDSSYVWSTSDNRWQKGLGWTIPNNQWYQYTFTYSGGTLLSYRDGVQNGSYTVAGPAPLPQVTGNWNIGGWTAGNSSFQGNLSDVSFWSAGLTQGKTASLYNITTVNTGALADYDALRMKTLFTAYDTNVPLVVTSTAGALEWEKFTGLAGTSGGATFDAGTQTYRVWFDSNSGVVAVPEPAGLAGLGASLLLLGAAGRRGFRRRAAG